MLSYLLYSSPSSRANYLVSNIIANCSVTLYKQRPFLRISTACPLYSSKPHPFHKFACVVLALWLHRLGVVDSLLHVGIQTPLSWGHRSQSRLQYQRPCCTGLPLSIRSFDRPLHTRVQIQSRSQRLRQRRQGAPCPRTVLTSWSGLQTRRSKSIKPASTRQRAPILRQFQLSPRWLQSRQLPPHISGMARSYLSRCPELLEIGPW